LFTPLEAHFTQNGHKQIHTLPAYTLMDKEPIRIDSFSLIVLVDMVFSTSTLAQVIFTCANHFKDTVQKKIMMLLFNVYNIPEMIHSWLS
jgi:hypothetical protein